MSVFEKSQEQKYQHVTAILKGWREQTSLACEAYHEAKQSECWRLHHKTWKEFIEACGFTEQWGLQLSKTGQRIAELRELLASPAGTTEFNPDADLLTKVGHLTPGTRKVLDSIPTVQQLEVLAKTKSPTPTVAEVKKAKAEVAAEKIHEAEIIPTDANGTTIPVKVRELWQEAERTVDALLPHAKALKAAFKVGVETKETNKVWIEVNNTDGSAAQQLLNTINLHIAPHAVCYVCNGVNSSKCKLCKGRGFVGKHLWSTCPEETKKLVEKAVKK